MSGIGSFLALFGSLIGFGKELRKIEKDPFSTESLTMVQ